MDSIAFFFLLFHCCILVEFFFLIFYLFSSFWKNDEKLSEIKLKKQAFLTENKERH